MHVSPWASNLGSCVRRHWASHHCGWWTGTWCHWQLLHWLPRWHWRRLVGGFGGSWNTPRPHGRSWTCRRLLQELGLNQTPQLIDLLALLSHLVNQLIHRVHLELRGFQIRLITLFMANTMVIRKLASDWPKLPRPLCGEPRALPGAST